MKLYVAASPLYIATIPQGLRDYDAASVFKFLQQLASPNVSA